MGNVATRISHSKDRFRAKKLWPHSRGKNSTAETTLPPPPTTAEALSSPPTSEPVPEELEEIITATENGMIGGTFLSSNVSNPLTKHASLPEPTTTKTPASHSALPPVHASGLTSEPWTVGSGQAGSSTASGSPVSVKHEGDAIDERELSGFGKVKTRAEEAGGHRKSGEEGGVKWKGIDELNMRSVA